MIGPPTRAIPARAKSARNTPDKSVLLDSGDLANLPQPQYIVGETFQLGAVTLLHGRYGTGKSQGAMAIMGAVAYGDTWGDETFLKGLAVYVGCENFAASDVRYRAWCLLTKHAPSSVDGLAWFDGEEMKFNILTDIDKLTSMIELRCQTRKIPAIVVVIDHIRRALRGPNALGSKVAAEVMDNLERMAKRLNCAVIVIAHTNKSNSSMAGPAVYTNYAQAEHSMISEGGDVVRLCGVKQRDASPADILFTRRTAEVAPALRKGGRPITSAALLFHSFNEAKSGQSKLDDTAYLVALHIEPGEYLSYAEVCRRCELNIGGEQNRRLRAAVPADAWKKVVVGNIVKALKRVKVRPPNEKEKELFYCASLDDLDVYPLSEQPTGGSAKPKPRRPPKPRDTGPKAEAVLSLCDRTMHMVQPWADAGFKCICVDLQHPNGEHRHGNITLIGADIRTWQPTSLHYRIVFAFPPCTNLAVSGAAHFRFKGLPGLREAIELVEACERICNVTQAPWMIENPVSTLSTYWREPDYTFHPYEFGGWPGGGNDGYTKKTCLWVGNGFRFPEMKPIPVDKPDYIHHMPPSPQRSDLRSVTPKGFARAIFEANVGHLGKMAA